MKNLLEGSKISNTDVKYKSKQHIEGAPVIINVNASSLTSMFNWCNKELPPFNSHCFFENEVAVVI